METIENVCRLGESQETRVTIVRDGGVWIARNQHDQGLFAPDLLELAQLLKKCGWV